MTDMDRTLADLDSFICEMDDFKIERGEPIISVLVTNSDGSVIRAFWKTVEKHPHLRLNGESDAALITRLHAEAFAYEKGAMH